MNKLQIVKDAINQYDGIVKTSQLISLGLTSSDVAKLCKKNEIERIRNGFYILPGQFIFSDEKLISVFIPEAIVCVETALYHYGYSDFAPRQWNLAVPRTFSRSKLNISNVPINVRYIDNSVINVGQTTDLFNGISLSVYDRERTICDCFKYRSRLDNEIFNMAIKKYILDHNKKLSNLGIYAKKLKVYNKVMNLMEVMLNG